MNKKTNIIIVLYNAPEQEKKCIDAVKKHTKNYTLTIVDNYKKKEGLSTVWNREIKKSKEEFIVLLNNDAYVTEGWLDELYKGMEENVIAVGPSGQCGGIQRSINYDQAQQKKGQFQNNIELSGFCMLIRKTDIKFPEEVPFYGNEHAWMVKAFRQGWQTKWAMGAYVYHEGGASTQKHGLTQLLRTEGPKQYVKWLAKTSPVLFTTYNRLKYTRKTLLALIKSKTGKIYVIDNNSSDGTKEYLKEMESKHKNRLEIIYNNNNEGVVGAMNQFLDITKGEEVVGKIDNDTMVKKEWFETMLLAFRYQKIDVMQAKHKFMHRNFNSFDDWMGTLQPDERFNLRYSEFVGGSGLIINRKKIDHVPPATWKLGGWTTFLKRRNDLRKCFHCDVEVDLLDMEADNKPRGEDFSYHASTGRIKTEGMVEQIRNYNANETINAITKRLGKTFAYTRFGDGELLMMEDFNGHPHTQFTSPKFKKELIESFKINHEDYLIGSSADLVKEEQARPGLFAPFTYGNVNYNDRLVRISNKYHQNKSFYSPIAFHYWYKFHRDKLDNFFETLKKYKVCFVGGGHLKEIPQKYGFSYVETPSEQAYDTINQWYPKVKEEAIKCDVLLMSLSMTSEVLIKRLWCENAKVGMIDFGSVANAMVNYKGDKHNWIKQ